MSGYFKNKRIITLLAHPDDETLGCGGTLHRASEDGAIIHCVIPAYPRMESIKDDCAKALEVLGVQSVHWGRFDDNEMDKYPLMSVAKFFESQIEKFKPDIVFLHHWSCTNQDHRVCYEAGIIANRNNSAQLICCEIPSSMGYLKPNEFDPNFYVVLDYHNKNAKIEAMEFYKTELRDNPHPRCVSNLVNRAYIRGGDVNTHNAEAFVKIREVA